MDCYRRVIPHGIVPPNPLVQDLSAEYNIRIRHQKQQQLVFLIFLFDFCSLHKNPPGILLKQNITYLNLHPILSPRMFQAIILGKIRFDPSHQYVGRKGLSNVIVRAHAKPPDFIDILLTRCHH